MLKLLQQTVIKQITGVGRKQVSALSTEVKDWIGKGYSNQIGFCY